MCDCFRVLIVDDEMFTGEIIASFTRYAFEYIYGNEVEVKISLEISAVKAYKTLSDGQYDLLLTDCEMPEVNGVELIKKVRKNEKTKKISIIGVSSYPGNKRPMMEAGADYFIGKPFELNRFADAVEKVLNKE